MVGGICLSDILTSCKVGLEWHEKIVLLKGYKTSLSCQPCANIWFDTLTTDFCREVIIALRIQRDFV